MAYGLAEKARGRTSPNPLVGAVVVRDGKVVGHGFHEGPGKPHAEILALGMAGRRAKGATLYLTLEPCVHWGRTAPCVDAVLAAGLGRVVVSAVDPNPLVDGKGIRRLEEAGLDVSVGLLAERNAALNEAHAKFIVRKVPFVTLKAALTLDGKIACRERRLEMDLLGRDARLRPSPARRTGRAHDRRRDARRRRPAPHRAPRELARRRRSSGSSSTPGLRFPLTSRILSTLDRGRIAVFAGREAPAEKARALEALGVEVLFPRDGAKAWSLAGVLAELGRLEIAALLVEGGSRVFTSFIESGLADKAVLTLAPRLVGGASAPGFVGGMGVDRAAHGIALKRARSFSIEDDIIVEGYF